MSEKQFLAEWDDMDQATFSLETVHSVYRMRDRVTHEEVRDKHGTGVKMGGFLGRALNLALLDYAPSQQAIILADMVEDWGEMLVPLDKHSDAFWEMVAAARKFRDAMRKETFNA